MPAYDFGSRGQAKPPRSSSLAQFLQLDLKGLDMVSPVDLMKSGRTPYAKNFRLYAQQSLLFQMNPKQNILIFPMFLHLLSSNFLIYFLRTYLKYYFFS